jgi:hypothetical protein
MINMGVEAHRTMPVGLRSIIISIYINKYDRLMRSILAGSAARKARRTPSTRSVNRGLCMVLCMDAHGA